MTPLFNTFLHIPPATLADSCDVSRAGARSCTVSALPALRLLTFLLALLCALALSRAALAQTPSGPVARPLEVPVNLAGKFPTDRTLAVPAGFGIRVIALVPNARYMALAPNGDVLVSQPAEGKITLLRRQTDGSLQTSNFASGLSFPHDMVFHRIGNTVYLYIAESNRITRSVVQANASTLGPSQVVVSNLPDNSTPELRGNYGHQLKNIAIGPDNTLYVSIGSATNNGVGDLSGDPVRGAIYRYDADGANGRLYATGLRNAAGLDILPGTNTLWATVNNRDNIKVPANTDVNGDGASDAGTEATPYIDENPPELFTAVRDGGNYGWPYCNAIPNATMSNLESLPDYDTNRDGTALNCAAIDRASKGILAHSAPLGLSFLQDTAVPTTLRYGAAIALHGCWNCSTLRAGYKVVFFPFDQNGNPGTEIDLITGFVTNPQTREVWGRPVDVIADAIGNLLISDDAAGAIYQLYPLPMTSQSAGSAAGSANVAQGTSPQ